MAASTSKALWDMHKDLGLSISMPSVWILTGRGRIVCDGMEVFSGPYGDAVRWMEHCAETRQRERLDR